jgi:hypothetical protein
MLKKPDVPPDVLARRERSRRARQRRRRQWLKDVCYLSSGANR